jgi:hypothetical protein
VNDSRKLTRDSAVIEALSKAERTLGHAMDGASTAQFVGRLGRYWTQSRTASWTRLVQHWIKVSWLFQWLTKEPEPDVILIDLRETITVGPVLHLLDWLVASSAPWWESSVVAQLFRTGGEGVEQWNDVAERSHAVRVLGLVLLPPEADSSEDDSESVGEQSNSEFVDTGNKVKSDANTENETCRTKD